MPLVPMRERSRQASNVESAPTPHSRLHAPDGRSLKKDTRLLTCISTLTCANSVAPGFANYLSKTHLDVYANETLTRTNLAEHLSLAINVLLMFVCTYAWTSRRASIAPRLGDGALLAFVLLLFLIDDAQRGTLPNSDVVNTVTILSMVLALWCLRVPEETAFLVYGRTLAVVIAANLIFGIADPTHAYYASITGVIGESTKAIIGNNQLAGAYGHSNTLGIVCALAIPFLTTLRSRQMRIALCLAAAFVLLWSASRTSLIAAAIALCIMLVARMFSSHLRKFCLAAAAVAAFTAVVLVPIFTTDPTDFTRRGAIWIGSLQYVRSSWLLGLGWTWYSRIAEYGNSLGDQASSGHNWFISMFTLTGIFGLLPGAVLLLRLWQRAVVSSARRSLSRQPALWFWYTLVVVFVLEFPWEASTRSDIFFSVPFAMMLILRFAGADKIDVPPEILRSDHRVRRQAKGRRGATIPQPYFTDASPHL